MSLYESTARTRIILRFYFSPILSGNKPFGLDMTGPELFSANIAVRACDRGRIITERVACRHHTKLLAARPYDVQMPEKARQYRMDILNMIRATAQPHSPETEVTGADKSDMMPMESKYGNELVEKFVSLAETLDVSKAVAFHFESDDTQNKAFIQNWDSAMDDANGHGGTSLHHSLELFEYPSIRHGLLHPLLVALLAYSLGGPVNAANTAFAHAWRLPEASAAGTHNFYMEGDCGDVFDDLRLTLVWEAGDGQLKGVSGEHHVFLTNDAIPRPLQTICEAGNSGRCSPITIVYAPNNAALCYDCPDPASVRNSLTLDIHLNTITDDELHLLSDENTEVNMQEMALTKLVTRFPILNYDSHFHRLLFADSLNVIIGALSTLDTPIPQSAPEKVQRPLKQRLESYQRDNWDRTPHFIRSMEVDVPITGTYSSPASFLNSLHLKVCIDLHLPIGINLFPQTLLDENLESARKFVRHLPGGFILMRLTQYAPALLQIPYTPQDLVSTASLQFLANSVCHRCFEIMGAGFVDDDSYLPSFAALSSAFGNAINGPKEMQVTLEPWVDNTDFQVFRTRCLYLFWSADWLVCYLGKPKVGPFMVVDLEQARQSLETIRVEVGHTARLLLRNWVAWGMFVEGLPQGGFNVRRPADFEENN